LSTLHSLAIEPIVGQMIPCSSSIRSICAFLFPFL
jgi:hypothetical protein